MTVTTAKAKIRLRIHHDGRVYKWYEIDGLVWGWGPYANKERPLYGQTKLTITTATESLADLGVEIDYQSDNSIVLHKGWLSITISASDAEALYQFIKAQRKKEGLPT